MWRIRSGFVSNVFGFGARKQITPGPRSAPTSSSGHSWRARAGRRTSRNRSTRGRATRSSRVPGAPSWRDGRARCSTAAETAIDALYAHRWGVGFPSTQSPWTRRARAVGRIGFGLHGSGFAPGLAYTTPTFGGLKLDIGAFNPIQLPGRGWTRTNVLRPGGGADLQSQVRRDGKDRSVRERHLPEGVQGRPLRHAALRRNGRTASVTADASSSGPCTWASRATTAAAWG